MSEKVRLNPHTCFIGLAALIKSELLLYPAPTSEGGWYGNSEITT